MGLIVATGIAETISVVTVLESVAAVGAALSVVGAVTKNKTLSMIGAGLGVVGGVGALAAGALGAASVGLGAGTAAGDAAATAAAGDSAFVTGTAAGDAALNAGGTGVGALGGGVSGAALTTETAGFGAANAVPDVVGSLAGTPPPGSGLSGQANPELNTPSGATQAPPPITDQTTLAGSATPIGEVQPAAPSGGTANVVPNLPPGALTPSGAASDLIGTPPQPPANLGATDPLTGNNIETAIDPTTGKMVSLPDTSTLGSLAAFAKGNPLVAYGALQAGGSLLSGAFSTLTPAQVNSLNSQAAANDAAAAQQRMQTANLAAPKAVASSTPVTGTPAQLVPTPAGFINQPRPAVTGAPA
jgi:hypothetical protein